MNGEEALRGYGYIERKGKMSLPARKRSQHWQATEGGWLRFDDAEMKPMPWGIKDAFKGISGIDLNNPDHAACFEWVWPDAEVARIYSAAIVERQRYLDERAARKANADTGEVTAMEQADAAEDEAANVTAQIDALAEHLKAEEVTIGEPPATEPKRHWWQR